MTTATTELVPSYLDVTRLAVGSFLARYREPTLTAYTQDLRAFLGWCQTYDHDVMRAPRGEPEMYVRYLEGRGYAAAWRGTERNRHYSRSDRRWMSSQGRPPGARIALWKILLPSAWHPSI